MNSRVGPAKDLEYYLGLCYSVQMTRRREDGEEYWFVEILELHGCMADGKTPDEAIDNLEETKRLWIVSCLEDDHAVPEPGDTEGFSGKFLVRMPKSLHRTLANKARREGVSLNRYVGSSLAGEVNGADQIGEFRRIVEELSSDVRAANLIAAAALNSVAD